MFTIQPSVIWLDVQCLDFAVLNLKGITLASWATENGSTIESQVQGLGEFGSWVSKEADLQLNSTSA